VEREEEEKVRNIVVKVLEKECVEKLLDVPTNAK
jgi:hypothetical protein